MSRLRKLKGASIIEFVLGFMGLWLMLMMWVEMSFMSYISAINDVAIAESSRRAKLGSSDYKEAFEDALKSHGSIWSYIANSEDFRLSVEYLEDIEDLDDAVEGCEIPDGGFSIECGDPENNAIAIYRTTYHYQPIFAFFMDSESVFGREVIVVQEYERTEFQI